jgi:hypothetical protein
MVELGDFSMKTEVEKDGNTYNPAAKQVAQETTCFILLKQRGERERGWKDAPFWWLLLIAPANAQPAIFASGTIKDNDE